ncbi:MAG: CocE/NonD family hydrolase [Armatimonadetes bacterium]|nr:CocE/NonD family hydrolase [Armatimonadota bacterium]
MSLLRARRWLRPVLLLAVLSLIWVGKTAGQQASPVKQTVMVPMSDGVKLATDIYLPVANSRFPVILARTPYGKGAGLGLAAGITKMGYAVVVQDTRGRFASEGANMPFEADGWANGKQDGYDTVEWIARQPWANGKVGTWGGSALGIAQLLMAATTPPHLVCQHIGVATPSFFRDGIYPGGAFHKAMSEDWLEASKFDSAALKTWVSHPTEDDYWSSQSLDRRWKKVNVPAVHVGGWYDIFTQGTIDAFTGYQYRGGPGARGRQKLVVGPWTHGVGNVQIGEVTFPATAAGPPNGFADQWRWFARWLKGEDNGIDREPAVAYYVMGDTTDPKAPGNVWRTAPRWPVPARMTPYYLHADKSLTPDRPGGDGPITYTYDPKNPVPTVGGNHLTLPAGPKDQRSIESRPDVLVFTSQPLESPLEVTGRVRVRLWVSSDSPDTDFTAKLCDVYPDGHSLNICDGILRARFRKSFRRPEFMQPGRVYPVTIDLWSTSMIFNKGHRLRVQVSSSNFPAYDPNPNTGEGFRASDKTQAARNTVYVDRKRPSHIVLPVRAGGWEGIKARISCYMDAVCERSANIAAICCAAGRSRTWPDHLTASSPAC